jgi:hypothetical protein
MQESESPINQPYDATADGAQPAVTQAASRRRSLVLGVAVGTLVTLAVAAAVAVALFRDTTPRLTRAEYDRAWAQWEEHGPASYDMDLELAGNRPGKVHVEVRDGQVTHMMRDGVEPKQRRTWDYWSVPGQFDTIGQELDMAEQPAKSFGASGAAQVVMWAEFDPRFGYPTRYDRVVLGADLETHWKTTRFQAIDEKK